MRFRNNFKTARSLMLAFAAAGLVTTDAGAQQENAAEEAKPLLTKLNLSDTREKKLTEELSALREQGNGAAWPETLRRDLAQGGAVKQFMRDHGFRAEELAWIDELNGDQSGAVPTAAAILYLRLLLQQGPAEYEDAWPKWNEGDTPGSEPKEEQRTAPTLRQLAKDAADLPALLKTFVPKNAVYQMLQPQYAEMAKNLEKLQKEFVAIPEIEDGKTVNVGDSYAGVPQLVRRLQEEGLLPKGQGKSGSGTTYTQEISDAVKRFQEKQGRAVDGILGPNTLAELNRSPSEKLEMLRINLHRARMLPDAPGDRHIIVNVPSNRVFVFSGDGAPALMMKAIVGKSMEERQTPVFRDVMQTVEFGPYWNVPISIATNEIVPKARENSGYLAENQYEIVSKYEASETVPVSSSALSQVESGELLIRQKPGPENALGRVKFLFPNDYAIYLHDTPSDQLFQEAERTFSHGCIRVEKPAALAEYVLGPQGWALPKIEEKLKKAQGERVDVEKPVNVYIVYLTAFPTWDKEDDRKVRFYPEIYGRDDALLKKKQTATGASQ